MQKSRGIIMIDSLIYWFAEYWGFIILIMIIFVAYKADTTEDDDYFY